MGANVKSSSKINVYEETTDAVRDQDLGRRFGCSSVRKAAGAYASYHVLHGTGEVMSQVDGARAVFRGCAKRKGLTTIEETEEGRGRAAKIESKECIEEVLGVCL